MPAANAQYNCPDHGSPVGLVGTDVPDVMRTEVEVVSIW